MAVYRKKKNGKPYGKWYICYYVDGRKIRRAVSYKKSEAIAAEEAIKTDLRRGEYRFQRDNKIRFENAAEEYLEYCKKRKRSWKRERTSIRTLLNFFEGFYLSRITVREIELYQNERSEQVKPATVNREIACLSCIFSWAKKHKKVNENPVLEVKKFDEHRRERILSEEEVTKLLGCSDGHLKDMIIIALNTSMRRGEILKLKWNDIDFRRNFIRITMENSKNKRERIVPMNSMVVEVLRGTDRVNDYIFYNPNTGRPLTTVRRSFTTACISAGIKDCTFHDLRRTALTFMGEKFPSAVVQKIAGHADLRTTQRYIIPRNDPKRQAVDFLASVFEQKSEKVDAIWTPEDEKDVATDLVSNS